MLENEKLLTLSEAAKLLPKMRGKPVHTSVLWRWGEARGPWGKTRGSLLRGATHNYGRGLGEVR
jgi:hypothetical protein